MSRRCLRCHQGDTARGGLSLQTREALVRGGESGPTIEPGQAEASLLIEMISGQQPLMPAEGEPLDEAEVSAIARWIDAGAAWPAETVLSAIEEEAWWSRRPLKRPDVPAVETPGVRSPIDAFIVATLREHGMQPSPEADRRTLIRRLSFDLIGLPPTPEEVEAFLTDEAPDAYEQLVDRLLDSPHYGERWGRHWLDVVHYGETHGYDKDKRRDHAWPYRDWVIRAFNDDMPYERFVRQQLAGDVLWPDDPQAIAATGFIAAGPWDFVGHVELREGSIEKEKTRLIDRDDMLANTMSTFTSVTAHCARCHDHPFDPMPQQDYYALQAVFAGVERGDRPWTNPAGEEALVYAVVSREPRAIHRLRRGTVEQPLEETGPGALTCLESLGVVYQTPSENEDNEGLRRAALADWIVDPNNPLTWRSIVNRVWHYHFGRGLVDTPNDFGRNGSLPTHPELLDWLAVEFRDGGGSLKQLHRLIVNSAVYRQESANRDDFAALDAGNRFFWRMNRRRLEAEAVRDAVLAVSGKLDRRLGGPSFAAFEFEDDHSPRYRYVLHDDPATLRRTVYRYIVRSVPDPWLEALDCPDPSLNTPVRETTITALQALALLNDPFIIRQAESMAERVAAEGSGIVEQVDRAYRLALCRPPNEAEQAALAAFIDQNGLAAACRVLLNSNEFMFVD